MEAEPKRSQIFIPSYLPASATSIHNAIPTLPLGNQVDQAALVQGQVSCEAAGGGGAGLGENGCDDAGGALVHGHQEDMGWKGDVQLELWVVVGYGLGGAMGMCS